MSNSKKVSAAAKFDAAKTANELEIRANELRAQAAKLLADADGMDIAVRELRKLIPAKKPAKAATVASKSKTARKTTAKLANPYKGVKTQAAFANGAQSAKQGKELGKPSEENRNMLNAWTRGYNSVKASA